MLSKFAIGLISLVGSILLFSFQDTHAEVPYIQPQETTKYGFVIGDQCGEVINTYLVNNDFSIHLLFPNGRKILCGQFVKDTLEGVLDGLSFRMTFGLRGRGHGVLSDGTEMLMIKGAKISHKKLCRRFKVNGLYEALKPWSKEVNLPLNEAIGYYVHTTLDDILVTFVYETGYTHEYFGPQSKSRTIISHYLAGQWTFKESL
ncbi:MAG: hypothetical protein AAFX87_12150 [Bacteroidota bacterium]